VEQVEVKVEQGLVSAVARVRLVLPPSGSCLRGLLYVEACVGPTVSPLSFGMANCALAAAPPPPRAGPPSNVVSVEAPRALALCWLGGFGKY
jgi:hypothetical protein